MDFNGRKIILIGRVSDKAEQLGQRVFLLESHVKKFIHFVPKAYKGREEIYDRLVLNNQRLGISLSITYAACSHKHLDSSQIDEVLSVLSERGDPLAEAYSRRYRAGDMSGIALDMNGVLKKIVTRQLTEQEYERELNNELDVTTRHLMSLI